MLSLLIYELLGGPRSAVETTGRYKPIAVLSEQGNSILRRGLIDELPSATEMARLLEGQILSRGVEPASTPTMVSSTLSVQSGGVPLKPPPPLPSISPPPVPLVSEKRRISLAGLVLVFGLIAVFLVGAGF